MQKALEEYAHRFEYQNIAISSHRQAIEALIQKLFHYKCNAVTNGSYVHISYDEDENIYEGIELPKKREY